MSSTSSTTSPDDAGSTSTEAIGEDAIRPFPAVGDTQPPTSPVTWPAAKPETQPVTMSLPASQDVGTETVSTGSAPASSVSSPVWSARTVTEQDRLQTPQDIKGSTLLRGASLFPVGGLLTAAGLGLRLDFTTTAIACLASLGALPVVTAPIPRGCCSTKKS